MATIRHKYEGQLDGLIKDLRRLGLYVYRNIEFGLTSLSEEDRNYARQTIAKDKEINEQETAINEKVVLLITKQQPIATDFERIGDNAASIAKIRLRAKIIDEYVLTRLNTMGKLALLMLKDLDDAVNDNDITLIKEIIDRDKDIDDIYKNIVNTTYLIDNDPFVAGQAHLAARHLERIGDHICNIAENIYFFITGERYESYNK